MLLAVSSGRPKPNQEQLGIPGLISGEKQHKGSLSQTQEGTSTNVLWDFDFSDGPARQCYSSPLLIPDWFSGTAFVCRVFTS